MAGQEESPSRKAPETIAVSSGDSSVEKDRVAMNGEAATLAGINSADATSPGAPIYAAGAPSSGAKKESTSVFRSIGATVFQPGDLLGGRYEITKLLGMGGMGAVYKAHDIEVARTVGLKVIRPDLAENPVILARFKQELVLARQITHKNIIRIYDLNEADGVKFITMEFIEGEDLRTILTREGKLAPKQAIDIMRQACSGLQAAHHEGVIHRDLKPGNIMKDGSGRVVIMDFGLAKTVQSDGMTQTGMMIGTMEYMSPEQAMGAELDARSDIFTMGLIFYELLTGNIPFRAESAIASLVKRTQERAVPLSHVDPTIPPELSLITAKCLERDRNLRYNNVQELIDDLDIFEGRRSRSSTPGQSALRTSAFKGQTGVAQSQVGIEAVQPPKKLPVKWVTIGVAALLFAVGGGVLLKSKIGGGAGIRTPQPAAVSLAIVPFYNESSDPSLNWLSSSLSLTFSTDIGNSQRARLVSPSRLQQVLRDLHISPQSQLDLSTLKRIADFTNATTVVYGQYSKFGDQIRINATVYDLKNDHTYALKTDVPSEKDLLAGLDNLASEVRAHFSTDPDVIKELTGQSQFTLTKSVPALRAYDEALALSRSGKEQEAAKKFEDAVTEDANFALAYSKLALSYHKLGFDDKAQQTSRRAVALSENLPTREKYLVEANHAVVMNDTAKATAAYEKLTQANPDDTDSQLALAALYEDASSYAEARKRLARVRSSDPNNLDALLASGRVEIAAGNPQAGLEFLNRAYSLATQFGKDETKASIEQKMGTAYFNLNQFDEALKNFQAALEIRKRLGLEKVVASSLNMIGWTEAKRGNSKEALANYKESLAGFQKIGDKANTAAVLLNLGAFYGDHAEYEDAIKVTNDALTLYRDLNDEADQALCLNNLGTLRRYLGNFQDALTYYQQSYQMREKLKLSEDMAESLYNLADVNVDLGQYDTAIGQYLKALEIHRASGDRVGIALNSSGVGALYASQGKYGSALSALQEAVSEYEQAKDQTWENAEAMCRYGKALSEVGRWDEGRKYLDNAVKLATDVKNDGIIAEVLNFQGDSYFYAGDYSSARQQYEKAMQMATKAKNREVLTRSKFDLARLDVMQNRPVAAIPVLKKLVEETDAVGLRALSVQSSLYLAKALLDIGKPQDAQAELDRAMNRAEKLGLLVEQAQAHFLLGQSYSRTGRTNQYAPQYQEAVRILESISKEPGVGRLLDRSDLKDVYQQSAKSYQGAA